MGDNSVLYYAKGVLGGVLCFVKLLAWGLVTAVFVPPTLLSLCRCNLL